MAMSACTSEANTPRRPPRVAVSTPVRNALRKLTGNPAILEDIKNFIEHEPSYSSLELQLVMAEVEANKVNQFLLVIHKVKYYDHKIGPYDSIKIVVKEDSTFSLLVYDKTMEEGRVKALLTSSHIVPGLNKLANPCMVVCSGMQDYSLFKASIGYDTSRGVLISCPPVSVCDIECTMMYENKSTQRKSFVCSKCNSLKWNFQDQSMNTTTSPLLKEWNDNLVALMFHLMY